MRKARSTLVNCLLVNGVPIKIVEQKPESVSRSHLLREES